MEAATQPAAQEPRLTGRVLEALATLAAFLDRTINEVRTLEGQFEERLNQAVQQAETVVRQETAAQLEQAVTQAAERQRVQLAAELSERFEREKEELLAEMRLQFDAERRQLEAEIDRLSTDLGRVAEAGAEWEAERARLNAELEEGRSELARLGEALAAAQQETSEPPQADGESTRPAAALQAEIERVEAQIREITEIIDDPGTELATVIRKNVERSELESYLRGIRFAAGSL